MAAKPLIVIVGPTASGKSALGMHLAKKFNGEIICADSRTVYKYLDIGTAKPSLDDQKEIKHHLLDVVNPDDSFTAADFKKLANEAIIDITNRGRLPLLVGGSGLYIDAVLYDYVFSSKDAKRDSKNPRHVSKDEPRSKSPLRSNTLLLGIKPDNHDVKQRISKRVEEMVDKGFIDEVKKLVEQFPSSKALLAPGYKAFNRYIDGELTIEEAKELFIRNDYQLAKRQMTWFKRNKSIHWLTQQRQSVDLVTTFLYK